jgi:hypothetical protein
MSTSMAYGGRSGGVKNEHWMRRRAALSAAA